MCKKKNVEKNIEENMEANIEENIEENRNSKKRLFSKEWLQGAIGVIAMLVLPVAAFYLMEFYGHNPFEEVREKATILNIWLFELIAWFLFFVTGRARVALSIELALAMVYGIANTYVVRFRTNPIVPWDFFSIKTAASVASNYDMTPDEQMIKVTAVFALLLVLVQFVRLSMPKLQFRKNTIKEIVSSRENQLAGVARAVPAMMIWTLLVSFVGDLQDEDFQTKNRLYPYLFTPAHMTNVNGMAVTFAMNLAYMSIEVPEGYDKEEIENILGVYEVLANENDQNTEEETETIVGETEELPNIIVIMNEAFADMTALSDFETNEDPLPFLHLLQKGTEDTITGNLQVSVCGGNTANSEFEFLTGNSMAFLPQGSIPYQQYLHGEVEALPAYLKSLGYQTVATHPYNASGWERDDIYPQMGFERSIFISEYNRKEKLRSYISDDACANKIIKLYEEKEEGQPLFVFNVTMQNHGGYSDLYDNFTPDIKAEGIDSIAVSQYLSLIKRSDEMLEKLVSYFAGQDEKTIIVFFGDHQPNDSVAGPILKAEGKNVNTLTEEELKDRYIVPYVIWANYDIAEETNADTSLNYLGMKTLEAAGIPLPAYQGFLSDLEEVYPVISTMQVEKADGTLVESTEDEEGLLLYESIQYYQLFDSGE